MKDYKNWQGSREELLKIISSLENQEPKKYKMFSKKLNTFLPVKERRIQQFIVQGILPKAEFDEKGYLYNSEHIYRYFAAIKLKNSGYSLVQTNDILKGMELEEIIEKILEEKNSKNKINDSSNLLINKSDLPERLKKLGRIEGRVLRSQWIKFAITKWCHLDIKKKELIKLTNEDIDTLTQAFKDTLSSTSKVKNIDRSIG